MVKIDTNNFKLIPVKKTKVKETVNNNNSYFNYSKDKDKLFVYFHYYDKEQKPFYIGYGSIDRAFHFSSRNKKWKEYVQDESKVKVKIKAFDLPKEELEHIENRLITRYKPVCNISEGNGCKGLTSSKSKSGVSVQKFTLTNDFVDFYYTIKDAANSVNGDSHNLRKAIAENKSYKGYRFVYYKED